MASCCCAVNSLPSSVWNTTDPVAPEVSGISSASLSVTFEVSVPGMLTVDTSVPPNAKNAPTPSPRRISQEAMTTQARFAEKRPSL